MERRFGRSTGPLPLLLLLALLFAGSTAVEAARQRLKHKLFPSGPNALHDRISTSDPANAPLTAAAFLRGDSDAGLLQRWESALQDRPLAPQRVEQQVLTYSQSQQQAARQQQHDTVLLEQGWVAEGQRAGSFDPKRWPNPPIEQGPAGPFAQPGPAGAHNRIEGALGVHSAAIPWDYRSYSGRLNSHRRAEPLIYTPVVLAKDEAGQSAVDLTSLLNPKYAQQRRSSLPQYSKTLSSLTEFDPVEPNPSSHWLPRLPEQQGPKKAWEKHFLDLYAPTPPPLLAPVPPQPPRRAGDIALVEQRSTVVAPLPEILTRGPRVQPLVSPVHDANQQPVPFRNLDAEAAVQRRAREVNFAAPARVHDPWMQEAALAAVYLEQEVQIEPAALRSIDISMPYPMLEEEVQWN